MTHFMLLHAFHHELRRPNDLQYKVQSIVKSSTSNIKYFVQRMNHSTSPKCNDNLLISIGVLLEIY